MTPPTMKADTLRKYLTPFLQPAPMPYHPSRNPFPPLAVRGSSTLLPPQAVRGQRSAMLPGS